MTSKINPDQSAASRFHAPEPADRGSRAKAITDLLASSAATKYFVPARGGYYEAPVIVVDQSLLVYRAGNGRLISELAAAGVSSDQRDDAAQQQQLHDLLIEMARNPQGPIFAEFERHARQTEPLLISRDGIVVNGNRRLASMRELLARDPERFAAFATVSVAVLAAEAGDEEIEYIESALQMAPDLKLDYSWVNRRLKLRDHVERLRIPQDDILEAYRFEDPEAIEGELAELSLAEAYLRYLKEPGRYDLVAELEDDFLALKHELDTISNGRLVKLWTFAGFAMIAAREEMDRRLKHYFPFTRPRPFALVHWVLRSFAEELELLDPQPAGENRPIDKQAADVLLPILRDSKRASLVAARVVALSDRLRANEEQEIGGHQLLHHLGKAREALSILSRDDFSKRQSNKIRAELRALADFLPMFGNPLTADESDADESDAAESDPPVPDKPSLVKRLLGSGSTGD